MGRLQYDERDGYSYISDNGIEYELLEGCGLKGKSTSDILFIMLKYDENRNFSIDEFVGWFCGATLVTENDYRDEYLDTIKEFVEKYEDRHPELIPKKKYRVKIIAREVGYVEIEARSEIEAIELFKEFDRCDVVWDDNEYTDYVEDIEEI